MFFILSKTLNYLTMISVWLTVFLLFYLFLKNPKWKKRFLWAFVAVFFFFSNEFIANEVMRAWELPATPFDQIGRKYAVGIVLTGVTIGPRDPHDRVYFNRGADRVTHAVQLYKLGYIRHVLISGGSGRLVAPEEREADELKKVFLLMGVPEEDLSIENRSRNTYESAVEVKKILPDSVKASNCLLITSAFHMRRSHACYEKAGMEMDTFTTDFFSHPLEFRLDELLIPSLDAIVVWQKLIKEWVGLAAYKLAGYV
jgi:uncharacterized SAM-binding protein YcdF (DUF218 family)